MRRLSPLDEAIGLAARALGTVAGTPQTRRRPQALAGYSVPQRPATAQESGSPAPLSPADRQRSIGLMRVNQVGEICAQALYEGQAFATRNPALKAEFHRAAEEEADHLAWTSERLGELGGRPSLLNPLWYAGSLVMGLAASRSGDAASLGFMAETERQVERHLERHLALLPADDVRSRQILSAMKADEIAHGERAMAAGGRELPAPVRWAMALVSRVMTSTARYI